MPVPSHPRRPAIDFRPVAQADFPRFWEWRHRPHIAPWWESWAPATYEAALAEWTGLADGAVPERGYVILVDGDEVGYIEGSRLSRDPGLALQLALPRDAVRADLFIAEADRLGRGLGPAVVGRFYLAMMDESGLDLGTIDPHVDNRRAIRAYEKAGFSDLRTVDDPAGQLRIMLADRSALERALSSAEEPDGRGSAPARGYGSRLDPIR